MDRDLFTVGWKMLVVRGVVGIVFGILAIVWPIETATALMVLWGFWALLEGIGALVQAFQSKTQGSRLGMAVLGLIAVIAAFFAIFSPQVTVQTLTWIIGIWLIIRGVSEAVGAFSSEQITPRWLLLLGAALSILLGVFFVANPGRGAVGIAVWLGLIALAWGAVFVVMGLVLRHELAGASPAAPATA